MPTFIRRGHFVGLLALVNHIRAMAALIFVEYLLQKRELIHSDREILGAIFYDEYGMVVFLA